MVNVLKNLDKPQRDLFDKAMKNGGVVPPLEDGASLAEQEIRRGLMRTLEICGVLLKGSVTDVARAEFEQEHRDRR